MIKLIIFIAIVLAIQFLLFFYSRKLKKHNREHVLTRYNIKTAKEAWEYLQDPKIPEDDRLEIQEYYNEKD
jgi:hypothetical protein